MAVTFNLFSMVFELGLAWEKITPLSYTPFSGFNPFEAINTFEMLHFAGILIVVQTIV